MAVMSAQGEHPGAHTRRPVTHVNSPGLAASPLRFRPDAECALKAT
jgi:hypothetical protein